MRLAVIGLGSMGRRHAVNAAALGASVVGVDPAGTDLAIPLYPTIASLPSIDAAIIATPAERHYRDARTLLGKVPLLIEKPLGLLDDPWPPKVGLAWVGYNWRFDRRLAELRAALPPQVLYARLESSSSVREWRSDPRVYLPAGMALECSHEIDLLRWLLGDCVTWEAGPAWAGRNGVELLEVSGVCERGLFSLHLDWLVPTYRRRVVVGTLRAEMVWQARREDTPPTYRAEMEAFLDAAAGRGTGLATYGDGLAVLAFVRHLLGARVRTGTPRLN